MTDSTKQHELRAEAQHFLDAHRKMVLTVLDEHGHPNSSLMLYAADEDLNVYFGTRKAFGKYAALTNDNRVSMAVVQESVDPLQVVDMQGVAEVVPEGEKAERLKWFTEKNPAKYYVKDADDFVMFKIVPNGVRWLDATSGDLQIHDVMIHDSGTCATCGVGKDGGAATSPKGEKSEGHKEEHRSARPLLLQIVGGALVALVVLGMLPVLVAIAALVAGFALFATYNRGFNTWMKDELAPGTQPRSWFNWLESFTIRIFGKRV